MPTREEYITLFGEDFIEVLDSIDGLPLEIQNIITAVLDGMVFDVEIFATNIEKTISTMVSRGIETSAIIETLNADMQVGGRIFGQLSNNVKNAIVQGISDSAKFGQFQNYDLNKTFKWVTVGGHKICGDCESRQGLVNTFNEWERLGLPGSGWSVCQSYCYCVLDPTGTVSDQVQGVDVREKNA